MSAIVKFLMASFFLLILTFFVLLIVIRPEAIKATVETASLTSFSLDPGLNLLRFNLTTSITLRNPNRIMGVYYDQLRSEAYYDGARLGQPVALPTFFLGRKSTAAPVSPSFGGKTYYDNAQHFEWERWGGWFHVEVWLYSKTRYKTWSIITRKQSAPKLKCVLAFKLLQQQQPNGTTANYTEFTSTECEEDKPKYQE